MTEQLIGCTLLHAKPFQYAGTIVDLTQRSSVQEELARCGKHLAASFGLRGLFGVDFLATEERAWIIEVNPRYTASVEAWEEASGRSALVPHVRSFAAPGHFDLLEVDGSLDGGRKPVVIKGVLFARQDGFVVSTARCYRQEGWDSDLRYADIPQPGTPLASGEPILTLIVRGAERDAAWSRLADEVARLEAEELTQQA
jgi:predicted ATP-grasp superfamily ATP-dependent carboligase